MNHHREIKPKKRQHYVPQFYLKNWLNHDGLWVSNNMHKKPKIYSQKDTKKIAQENYFYGLKMDDVVWDMLSYRYSEEAKKSPLLNTILNDFKILKYADDVINKGWLVVNHDETLLASARENLNMINKIFIENKYSDIEAKISNAIKSLIETQQSKIFVPVSGDIYINLIIFYSTQLFRTKKIFSGTQNNFSQIILTREKEKTTLTQVQKETYFKCALYIMSIQFSLKMEKQCIGLKVSKNNTNVNYITSDSPSIYSQDTLFAAMPLSPQLFVEFILEKPQHSLHVPNNIWIEKIDVYDIESVKVTNKMIKSFSSDFLFAKELADLAF